MTRKPYKKRSLARVYNRCPGPFLDFLDPWGNRIEIVGYDNVQFSKAPNVLRGSSHNGNASGRELVGRGLVTAIASDYLPSGLLAAVFALEGEGLLSLPEAIGLVTAGPADVAGLPDRGRLQPGLRADMALIATGPLWPVVRSVLVSTR